MAYQNVKTPRFYIDYLGYLQTTGESNLTPYPSNFTAGLNPGTTVEETVTNNGSTVALGTDADVAIPKEMPLNFWATLGHNHGDATAQGRTISPHFHKSSADESWQQCQPYHTEIVNSDAGTSDNTFSPALNGFTITKMTASTTFDPTGQEFDIRKIYLSAGSTGTFTYKTGSIAIGKYYEMPHSPDLSLSMSHEYDGIKTIETKGGAVLSDMQYHKAPIWGEREAWQLGDWQQLNSGRRVWDLSFSYLSASDIEPYNYYGVAYASDTDEYTFISKTNDNWFSQVLYYTNGGQLPFIFQPDKDADYDDDTWTVPEFAICRFDMDTFTRTQVVNNVYNMKIKIVESW